MSECEICEKPVPDTDGQCEDCLNWARECDVCSKDIPHDEDVYVEHPSGHHFYVHDDCVPPTWWQYTDYPENAPVYQ